MDVSASERPRRRGDKPRERPLRAGTSRDISALTGVMRSHPTPSCSNGVPARIPLHERDAPNGIRTRVAALKGRRQPPDEQGSCDPPREWDQTGTNARPRRDIVGQLCQSDATSSSPSRRRPALAGSGPRIVRDGLFAPAVRVRSREPGFVPGHSGVVPVRRAFSADVDLVELVQVGRAACAQ
jgi:hypothetical protein